MSQLMLMANPRRKRRMRRKFRIMGNPRKSVATRRRSNRSVGYALGSYSGIGSIMSNVLPIGIGGVVGLALPKFVNLSGAMKYVAIGALGVASPVFLRGVLGRKNALLVGAGVLSVLVIQLVDELILKKQGKQTLADDFSAGEVQVISSNDELSDDDMSDDDMADDDLSDDEE